MKKHGYRKLCGPVVTAGGLVFIGRVTLTESSGAFDKATGDLLWETTLPFSVMRTATLDRRQRVI